MNVFNIESCVSAVEHKFSLGQKKFTKQCKYRTHGNSGVCISLLIFSILKKFIFAPYLFVMNKKTNLFGKCAFPIDSTMSDVQQKATILQFVPKAHFQFTDQW